MCQVSGVPHKSQDGNRFVFSNVQRLFHQLIYPIKITDAVHANGSYIYLQLWALGRAGEPGVLKREGGFDLVAPSPIPLRVSNGTEPGDNDVVPRELTVSELREYLQLYSKAASNAIEAGFDGVEVHAANGYLLDQFVQTVSNQRTDEYGGSIENRLRFPLEVINTVVETIGAERTAFRVSPWSKYQGEQYPARVLFVSNAAL